jgi:nicotinamide mononucleotide transporter
MIDSFLEPLAVVLALIYVLLAIKQNIFCWPAAVVSAAIYVWILYQAGLYMMTALQFVYIAMGFYGWISWRWDGADGTALQVSSWPPIFHFVLLTLIVFMTFVTGRLLENSSAAAFPYLDSFVTWSALVAIWLVARKVIQNWQYWFIADVISVYMLSAQGLWPTTGLYVVYLVLCPIGYRAWAKDLKQ